MVDVYMPNNFGLRAVNLAAGKKPLKGVPVGGNSENVVNPRNTFREEDIVKREDAGKWSYENMEWKNEA